VSSFPTVRGKIAAFSDLGPAINGLLRCRSRPIHQPDSLFSSIFWVVTRSGSLNCCALPHLVPRRHWAFSPWRRSPGGIVLLLRTSKLSVVIGDSTPSSNRPFFRFCFRSALSFRPPRCARFSFHPFFPGRFTGWVRFTHPTPELGTFSPSGPHFQGIFSLSRGAGPLQTPPRLHRYPRRRPPLAPQIRKLSVLFFLELRRRDSVFWLPYAIFSTRFFVRVLWPAACFVCSFLSPPPFSEFTNYLRFGIWLPWDDMQGWFPEAFARSFFSPPLPCGPVGSLWTKI